MFETSRRLTGTVTALAMVLTSIPVVPAQAQTTVTVNGRQVICLPNNDAACPKGKTCVVAKPTACENVARMKFGDAKPAKPAKKGEGQGQAGDKAARPAQEKRAKPAPKPAEPAPVQEKRAKPAPKPVDPAPVQEKRAKPVPKPAEPAPVQEKRAKPAPKPDATVTDTPPVQKRRTEALSPVEVLQQSQRIMVDGEAVWCLPRRSLECPPNTACVYGTDRGSCEKAARQFKSAENAGRLPELETSPGVAPPPRRAVETLSDILDDRAGGKQGRDRPAPRPLAADPDAGAGRGGLVERLTEEDTRRSSEDFDQPVVRDRKKKKDGLSDLEKVGLLVLGGLVVGSLLRNGDKVVSNSGDRVVAQRPDGTYYLLKDDDAALRQPGSEVRTETFEDGSTRTTVTQADGTRIVTIRNAAGRVLRRDRILPDGREVRLLDDTAPAPEIDVSRLPSTQGRVIGSEQDLAEALAALEAGRARGDLVGGFSLGQIRDIDRVRHLAPRMEVDNIVFASGSSAIRSSEAEKLDRLGRLMQDMVAQNPREIFLIEGHTDAVGGADYNLALSDRRAESLALALSEYFDIPAENMVVQGYGESELRVDTIMDEPRNRRAVVRVITPLMREAAAQ